MNKLQKAILKLDAKQRLIFAVTLITIVLILLFKIILAPQISQLKIAKKELEVIKIKSISKTTQMKKLTILESKYKNRTKELQVINKNFFSKKETDAFVKSFQDIAANHTVKVQMLNPSTKDLALSRSEGIISYIKSLRLRNEKEVLLFCTKNETKIDNDHKGKTTLKKAMRLVPENARAQLRSIWQQKQSENTKINLQTLEIKTILQGKYINILSFLGWLYNLDKSIYIHDVFMCEIKNSDEIKMSFTFDILKEKYKDKQNGY
jgi:Tfp pilus assembly protein PilO